MILVIYESTVYPGATEEDMRANVLEQFSSLVFNKDFFVGYSPERINPGDKKHTITKILKVTSGSTPEAALNRVLTTFMPRVITGRDSSGSKHKGCRGSKSDRKLAKRYQYSLCK